MDNPISWGILVILTICAVVWFYQKCEDEIARKKKENEDFWENWED